MKTKYSVLGVMAGSSMDGLDIVHVDFYKSENRWVYEIKEGETLPYSEEIYESLKDAAEMTFKDQKLLDQKFGDWIGECVNRFIKKNRSIDFLAVHGHTVIHQPQNNISWQLGSGNEISKKTGINTVTDFRSKDISLGGQGAPLVPVGDFQLFDDFDACLNLGGIANISVKEDQTAWDITPCNQVLNYYANQLGKAYDENGTLSREGILMTEFLKKVAKNSYFDNEPPKSLPNQFISEDFLSQFLPKIGLRSMTEFIAIQIAFDLARLKKSKRKMLVTGGGAHNSFLMERIKHHLPNWEITIPSKALIDFKEAAVFAFLSVLRLEGEKNVLASVTGASKDSSSGVIHFPK